MLFGSETYGWKCTDVELDQFHAALVDDPSLRYRKICEAQNESVQILYSLYNASEFLFGAIAGVSFDYLGPFITGCIGQALLLFGCLTIIVSSEALPLYILAVVFLGGSCNFIVFPALAAPDYFPGRAGLILSLTIAFQNGGAIVTTVLDAIFRAVPGLKLSVLFTFYLCCFLVPVGVCYLLSLPLLRYVLHPVYCPANAVVEEGHPQHQKEDQEQGIASPPQAIQIRRRRADLMTPEFIVFSVLVFLSTLQYNYYPVVLREISGDAIARFNGYIFPTQAIWGILYGLLVDYTTTLPIAYFLVALITAVYGLCLIPNEGLQYLTTSLYVLGNTYIYSIKFTYVAETFSPRNNGVIMGVLSIISGMTMFVNILLLRVGHTRGVIYGLLASVIFSFAIVGWLDRQRHRGVSYKGLVAPSPMQHKEEQKEGDAETKGAMALSAPSAASAITTTEDDEDKRPAAAAAATV